MVKAKALVLLALSICLFGIPDIQAQEGQALKLFEEKRKECLSYLEKQNMKAFIRRCVYQDRFSYDDEFRGIGIGAEELENSKLLYQKEVLEVFRRGKNDSHIELGNQSRVDYDIIHLYIENRKYNEREHPIIKWIAFENEFYVEDISFDEM
ncbi:MAG: hypothetical protein O9346_16705 [Leptospiraceae bacterium]|nr:hypothetical protein [Leptospiraceae bacterium]MCZ8348054.1 hypothetical protein [Leptospiraceae bacterium]